MRRNGGFAAASALYRMLDKGVTGADWTEGVVPRYGAFYGSGTSLCPAGEHVEQIRRRRFR